MTIDFKLIGQGIYSSVMDMDHIRVDLPFSKFGLKCLGCNDASL
ncbi:hypothetical protein SAMN05216225_100447 [Ornithinibacillus halophilus]|uniref:Uncharacterized protein n=1 Tax=Ornithinibacillus halophilus TaxID=930117 RepID=A0A1M5EBR5_9BACI|nr:hypothetical protein SAMN05216225_100447 [Ornithinibacillus halophilus]